jgi:hypothetical protein
MDIYHRGAISALHNAVVPYNWTKYIMELILETNVVSQIKPQLRQEFNYIMKKESH